MQWLLIALVAQTYAWTRLNRADPNALLSLRFALHSAAPQALETKLFNISNVNSQSYGKYLSIDEIAELAAPSEAATIAVESLLSAYNASHTRSSHGDYYQVEMLIGIAENMFATKLHVFQKDSRSIVRPHGSYKIPDTIREHVYLIDGLEYFPTNYKRQAQQVISTSASITLDVIKQHYSLPKDHDPSDARNGFIIGAFLKETYRDSDILNYYQRNGVKSTKLPQSVKCDGNGGDGFAGTGEASLDMQLVMGLTQNTDVSIYCYDANRDPSRPFADDNQEPFVNFLQDVNSLEIPPSVVSISYADDECAIPEAYITALDKEFIKAGLRGTTVVVASGDNGVVGSILVSFCGEPLCSRYQTGYPSSSPFVLSVGATQILNSPSQVDKFNKEIAVSTDTSGAITTGSGYSWYANRPEYQDKFVSEYNEAHPKHAKSTLFNQKGRVFPDVVAVGHDIPIYVNDRLQFTDGTSASAPIVGALLNHVNKYRLDNGLNLLGFINPYLYKLYEVCPGIFRDITVGNNKCGGRGQTCCSTGFEAGTGWDPLTGLGAIKYQEFVDNMMKCEALMHKKQSFVGASITKHNVTAYVALGIVLLAAMIAVFATRTTVQDDTAYKLVDG
ncbi:tripeptidyl-peptidase [Thraustotheca clavata]|uniref:subtilisin n=1 Tax=Thraustotheca clavata TaxID=74557 RepID=A0A1V9ZY68_9STRA|nr:tripeptidyl-peptidase [Thraustotheca clavata]